MLSTFLLAVALCLPVQASAGPSPVDPALADKKPAEPTPAPEIKLLVVRENGVGTASAAQVHLDALIARLAGVNGWAKASGHYLTTREGARAWIASQSPQFALLTLPAFLALSGELKLSVVGSADVPASGGRRYHVVSATAKTLAECKGKTLSSNHLDDLRFIDRVVAAGKFTTAQFELVPSQRPMQTLKMVTRGQAVCALIDDAQHEQMAKLGDGAALSSVWQSDELPPMVLVALPGASKSLTTRLQTTLTRVCSAQGKLVCDQAGIRALRRASGAEYKAALKAYGP